MARDLVWQDISCDEAGSAKAATPEEEAARWARFEALMARNGEGDVAEAAPSQPPRASASAAPVDMLAVFRKGVAADRIPSAGLTSAPLYPQRRTGPTPAMAALSLTAPADARALRPAPRPSLSARLPRSLRDAAAPAPKGAARRDWLSWRHRAEGAALAGAVAALFLALTGFEAPDATATGQNAPAVIAPERAAPPAAASLQDYAALERLVAEVVAETAASQPAMQTAPLLPLSLDVGGAPLGATFGPVDPWASTNELRAALSLGLMRLAAPTDALRASLDAAQG